MSLRIWQLLAACEQPKPKEAYREPAQKTCEILGDLLRDIGHTPFQGKKSLMQRSDFSAYPAPIVALRSGVKKDRVRLNFSNVASQHTVTTLFSRASAVVAVKAAALRPSVIDAFWLTAILVSLSRSRSGLLRQKRQSYSATSRGTRFNLREPNQQATSLITTGDVCVRKPRARLSSLRGRLQPWPG